VSIETPDGLIQQGMLPGRQGRVVLAYLALRHAPVPREELADVLWAGVPPPSWETALSAVISKLRALLRKTGSSVPAIESALGCYELRLGPGAWVDIDAATTAAHEAEAALRAGDFRTAWGAGSVAYHIARRPFLPGDDGPWIEQQRSDLLALHVRAAECFAAASLHNSEPALAATLAEELIRHEPFRETGYQLLMRAQAAAGSRAEALLTYERCRQLLAQELGADPSPETQALHLQLLVASV
jgi:DNA-binding SARP family transcriptional activator